MNEQTSGQLRQLLQALGTLANTMGVVNLTTGQLDMWINVAILVIGTVAQVGGFAWSYKVNRPVDLVASVVNLAKDPQSPVKGVVVENTMAGRELKSDIGADKIATAGSHDAKVIAATT
jgi:hypothetical protein